MVIATVTVNSYIFHFDLILLDIFEITLIKKTDIEKISAALQSYKDSGAGLDAVATQLNELKGTWSAKAEEIKALQDGLAAGKLEGDVTAKIAELTNYITTTETSITGMKETVNQTSEGSKMALETLKAAVSAYMTK